MIIKNVSGKALKYLTYWERRDWGNDYKIVATHEVKKTVKKPIPTYTDAFYIHDDSGGGYLAGFQDYYTKTRWSGWVLNKEYWEANRPCYSIDITYNLYDIELTEQGREKVLARYKLHQRCAERYASLLPTND